MQKQRNLNFKKKVVSKYRKTKINKINASKVKFSFLKIRKLLKHKHYFTNTTFQKLNKKNIAKSFTNRINIRITPNNVFCTLRNFSRNKTIYTTSAGKYNIKTSKKVVRFSSKLITQMFFEKIRSYLTSKKSIINIIGPKKVKKSILEQVTNNFKNTSLIVNVDSKKCFNGCRPPKKRRKKKKGLRIFK
jgi:ribosomal protein S11